MDNDKLPPVFRWIYYQDGTVWTNFTPDLQPVIRQEEPLDQPEPIANPEPRQLTCQRCDYTWTPRKKRNPVQCPFCKSPYWNKKRVYKKSAGLHN
jgi:hypothetical protein